MARNWWDHFEGKHSLDWSTFSGSIVATSAGIGDGSYVLKLDQNQTAERIFPIGFTECWLGFWFRTPALTLAYRDAQAGFGNIEYFLSWLDGSTSQIKLAISDTHHKFRLYLGSSSTPAAVGTFVFSDNRQYWVEVGFKLHASAGYVQARVDKVLALDTGLINTVSGGATSFDKLKMFSPNSGGFPAYFDSFVLNDPSGGVDDSWPGILQFAGQVSNGNSATHDDFSKSSGSSAFDLLKERPPDNDTTYIYSVADGQIQGVTFAAHGLPSNAVIKARSFEWVERKVTDGQDQHGIRIGGADYFGSTEDLGTSYAPAKRRLTQNPDTSAAWTLSDADTGEALIKSVIT